MVTGPSVAGLAPPPASPVCTASAPPTPLLWIVLSLKVQRLLTASLECVKAKIEALVL